MPFPESLFHEIEFVISEEVVWVDAVTNDIAKPSPKSWLRMIMDHIIEIKWCERQQLHFMVSGWFSLLAAGTHTFNYPTRRFISPDVYLLRAILFQLRSGKSVVLI
mgnify:CR=1 FL=1